MTLIEARFAGAETTIAEPGRGLVAGAGVIVAEVLLVCPKSDRDMHRWAT